MTLLLCFVFLFPVNLFNQQTTHVYGLGSVSVCLASTCTISSSAILSFSIKRKMRESFWVHWSEIQMGVNFLKLQTMYWSQECLLWSKWYEKSWAPVVYWVLRSFLDNFFYFGFGFSYCRSIFSIYYGVQVCDQLFPSQLNMN